MAVEKYITMFKNNRCMQRIGIFSICIMMGMVLNILAFLLPDKPIHSNVIKSIPTFEKEGNFPEIIQGYKGSILDNNSDGWMLLMCDYDGQESVIDKALSGYFKVYKIGGFVGTNNMIAMQDNEVIKIRSYSRYWHGWLFFLRFLLMFFDYSDIRALNMFMQIILLIYTFILMERRDLKQYYFAWIIAILAIFPIATMISMEYSFIYYIALSAVIVLLKAEKQVQKIFGFSTFFMLIGIITSYFDFLTYPILTLGFPLVFIFLLNLNKWEKQTILEKLKKIIGYSVMWVIGYGGMWASKWIMGSLLTEHNVIKEAVSQITLRTSHTSGVASVTDEKISYIITIMKNLEAICTLPFIILFLSGILIALWNVKNIIQEKQMKERISRAFPFFMIALFPFIWWIALENHSYLHSHFTYRGVVLCIFSGLVGIRVFCEKVSKNERQYVSN